MTSPIVDTPPGGGFPPGYVYVPPVEPPPPGPDDPEGATQRQQIAQALKQAVAANNADITQCDQIIASNPGAILTALAQQNKAQARQLNALIRLLGWIVKKFVSDFDRATN